MFNARRSMFVLAVLFIFIFSLVMPAAVLADEGTPPEVIPTEQAPAADPLLAEIPANTGLVVLDANGEPVALGSTAADEIIAVVDPVWCPNSATPHNDPLEACTTPFPSLYTLFEWLKINQPAADGTIWVEAVPDASTAPLILDGDSLTTLSTFSLTIKGGWDPLSATDDIVSYSTIRVPMSILNWHAPVEMSDLSFYGLSPAVPGPALQVDTSSDIILQEVSVVNSLAGGGAVLSSENADIDVRYSVFSTNAGDGLTASAGNDILLAAVSADNNAGDGAVLNADNNVLITYSNFFDNDGSGLLVTAEDDIVIAPEDEGDYYGAWVAGNGADGAVLDNSAGRGYIDIYMSNFDNNEGTGLIARSAGDILINESSANGIEMENTSDLTLLAVEPGSLEPVQDLGADLDTTAGEGSIEVVFSYFMDNRDGGLVAKSGSGGVFLFIDAEDNGLYFPYTTMPFDLYSEMIPATFITPIEPIVLNPNAFGAKVTTGGGPVIAFWSFLSGNAGRGLWVETAGRQEEIEDSGIVQLVDTEFFSNGQEGAYIHWMAPCNTLTGGIDVFVAGSNIYDNGSYGVYAFLGPEGTWTMEESGAGRNGDGTAAYDYFYFNGITYCETTTPGTAPAAGKPWLTVYAPDAGSGGKMDCDQYMGTIIILPNGDRVTLTCTIEGTATLKRKALEALPGALPQGLTLASGMDLSVTQNGVARPVITDGGRINVAFAVPADSAATYGILYWDPQANNNAGAWVEMPAFAANPDGTPLITSLHPGVTPDDGMRIFGGVYEEGDFVQVSVNFPGIFVLVTK